MGGGASVENGLTGGALPNWGGAQAGAQTGGLMDYNPATGQGQAPAWAQLPSYGTVTPSTAATSTAQTIVAPESAPRQNAAAIELYRAPPTAATAGVGNRNQVGAARFVNGTWTTFPSNHPDAPDYTGNNPGDWAAYGPQAYLPAGQKAQYSGKKAVAKKKATK